MKLTTTLARWTIVLEQSEWVKYLPDVARDLVIGGLWWLLSLVAAVEAVLLLFRLARSHGLRACFEAVKLAFSLLRIEDEEEDERGGQTTEGGFREAFFLQRNFHSAIDHLHAASSTFTSASGLTSRREAYETLEAFAKQPGQAPAASIDQTHLLLLSLARSWHDTISLPLQQAIFVRPDLVYRIKLAINPVGSNFSDTTALRGSFLAVDLPRLQESVGGRIEAISNRHLDHMHRQWATCQLLFLLALTFHPTSNALQHLDAAHVHLATQSHTYPLTRELWAKEAANKLKLQAMPADVDPPPYEPYRRFLQDVDLVVSAFVPALPPHEEVESLFEPYLRCTGAEIEATKAEEKLFEAVLDAVLARGEVKRMLRRKKLEEGAN